jgi:hypothetical protein
MRRQRRKLLRGVRLRAALKILAEAETMFPGSNFWIRE